MKEVKIVSIIVWAMRTVSDDIKRNIKKVEWNAQQNFYEKFASLAQPE